jgi:uncharacterized DUF497 family protein
MATDIEIDFDPVKDAKNLAKHGLSLGEAQDFDWELARIEEDVRKVYPERRFKATGLIGVRLHELVFCVRKGALRVISLRKSNPGEVRRHAN